VASKLISRNVSDERTDATEESIPGIVDLTDDIVSRIDLYGRLPRNEFCPDTVGNLNVLDSRLQLKTTDPTDVEREADNLEARPPAQPTDAERAGNECEGDEEPQ
jgi:hypothetical protein